MYRKHLTLKNFDLFCCPNSKVYDHYKYIWFNCLRDTTYIHYISIPNINGEISDYCFVVDLGSVKECLLNGDVVIAFNHCDNCILEVTLDDNL